MGLDGVTVSRTAEGELPRGGSFEFRAQNIKRFGRVIFSLSCCFLIYVNNVCDYLINLINYLINSICMHHDVLGNVCLLLSIILGS